MLDPHRTSNSSPPTTHRPHGWPATSAVSEDHVPVRRILWATDFSSCSEIALRYALAIARRYGSHLYLTHVVRPEAFDMVVPEAVTAMLEEARRDAEQRMAGLLVTGRLRGVSHQILIGTGELWAVLSKIVQEHGIDMIVVGTHGRAGFRKLLLGSVAQEIFRRATCPVLTVGPKAPGEVSEAIEPRRILFATDFTPASSISSRFALSLAREHRAQLLFLHVAEEGDFLSSETRARLTESAGRQMRSLIPPGAAQWHEAEFAVEFGSAAEMILKAAEENRADLIVLGGRRPSHLFGHASTDTAYKVVCGAACPVLTLPGEPAA